MESRTLIPLEVLSELMTAKRRTGLRHDKIKKKSHEICRSINFVERVR